MQILRPFLFFFIPLKLNSKAETRIIMVRGDAIGVCFITRTCIIIRMSPEVNIGILLLHNDPGTFTLWTDSTWEYQSIEPSEVK